MGRSPSCIIVTWEDKQHHSQHSPLLPSSPQLISWAWYHMVWNSPLVSLGPVPTVSPPKLPQLPCWRGSTKTRKDLGSVQALLHNNNNIPILSILCSAHTQNTAPYQPPWRKLILPQLKQAQLSILPSAQNSTKAELFHDTVCSFNCTCHSIWDFHI